MHEFGFADCPLRSAVDGLSAAALWLEVKALDFVLTCRLCFLSGGPHSLLGLPELSV